MQITAVTQLVDGRGGGEEGRMRERKGRVVT